MSQPQNSVARIKRYGLLLVAWVGLAASLQTAESASDLMTGFDQANRFYEQGQYREAAAAYEALLDQDPTSPTLQFNSGNAWFKAGDLGRAIAAYRAAERTLPRDPTIRFNLGFARKQLVGLPPPQSTPWERAITRLTSNEWTLLTVILFWIWMTLHILRQIYPPQRSIRPYLIGTALLALVPLTGLLLRLHLDHTARDAVVIASNASVRYGPLSESQTHFQLRDGAEVEILDLKDVQDETWFRIQDSTGRTGWIAALDLLQLR